MQPKASPGNKLSSFDKEGARNDSAPLRSLRAVTRIPAGRMTWATITLLVLGFLTACAATPDDARPAGHELRDLQAAVHHSDGASRPVAHRRANIDWDDLDAERAYDRMKRYAASKLATRCSSSNWIAACVPQARRSRR